LDRAATGIGSESFTAGYYKQALQLLLFVRSFNEPNKTRFPSADKLFLC
jgi:hypothetical protein